MIQSYNENKGKQKPYSVVIPVAKKDAKFVSTVVKFVFHNMCEVDHIYLITKFGLFERIERNLQENRNKCTLVDEDKLTPGLSYDFVKQCLLAHPHTNVNSTGWYLQQFLKFAFALSEYCGEYYLTWDSDTLPISKLFFFQDGQPLFTAKKEYHKPYFETLERLIGLKKTAPYSFIAEHVMFRKDFVLELIEEINNSKVEGENWVEKIINACDFQEDGGPYFSEFETYGTFCTVKHPGYYGIQHLNTFRSAAAIRGRHINDYVIEKLAADVDIASFEIHDERFPHDIERRKWVMINRINRLKSVSAGEGIRLIIKKLKKKMTGKRKEMV